jgi:ADP-ribose pyrophosphatase
VTSGPKAEIRTLSSRLVYENRWMKVREDEILRQDGSKCIYGVVEKTDFVAIAAIEDNGDFHLVEQYRYPVDGRFWELPQGSWETAPEADPLDVARGELREETGLEAGEIIRVGYLYECYGYSNQGCHVFLARQLSAQAQRLDHEEQGLVTRRFSAAEMVAMIESGAIRDATTVATIGLLMLKGLLPNLQQGAP